MKNQLFIPEKINVGFQSRSDTYTKQLAYIIYYDSKGVLRKEKSWQGWRDAKIDNVITENTPHSGFVLNKGVLRDGYWGNGHNMVRIYDDRGFEFEITVGNLLFILMTTNCHKRGLEGDFVYAWNGTELVLLPTGCEEYKNCVGYTSLQSKGVKAKELILGAVYETKKQEKWIYIGKYDWYEYEDYSYRRAKNKLTQEDANYSVRSSTKKYVFADTGDKKRIFAVSGIANLSRCINDTPADDYAKLVEKFSKMEQSSKVVSIEEGPAKPIKNDDYRKRITPFFKNDSNQYGYYSFHSEYRHNYLEPRQPATVTYKIKSSASKIYLKDGEIWKTFKTKESRYSSYRNDNKVYEQDDESYTGTVLSKEQYENYALPIYYAVLENGLKVPLGKLTNKDYSY